MYSSFKSSRVSVNVNLINKKSNELFDLRNANANYWNFRVDFAKLKVICRSLLAWSAWCALMFVTKHSILTPWNIMKSYKNESSRSKMNLVIILFHSNGILLFNMVHYSVFNICLPIIYSDSWHLNVRSKEFSTSSIGAHFYYLTYLQYSKALVGYPLRIFCLKSKIS